MRRNPTEPEKRLWRALSGAKLGGQIPGVLGRSLAECPQQRQLGAEALHQGAKGCFRVIKRDLQNLANVMNAKGVEKPTLEMTKVAIKQSLRG